MSIADNIITSCLSSYGSEGDLAVCLLWVDTCEEAWGWELSGNGCFTRCGGAHGPASALKMSAA